MKLDRLTAMNMFVRVVESGSFSAVAKELNTTQPTVSKNIAELESWLGAKLLNRSTRSLRLTETGTDYYERCIAILQDVEEAEQVVGQLQTQPRGLVRINTVVAFGRLHVLPRLPDFFTAFPDIKLDVRLNDRVVDLVEEGIDIAFRMGELPDSNLIARKLCDSPIVTVASPAYLERAGVPAHPAELRQHNYLAYSDATRRAETSFNEDGKPFHVRTEGNFQTNNTEAMRTALLQGMGISRAPRWLVGDAMLSGDLVEVLADYRPDPLALYAVYPSGRHQPSRVRSLLDYFSNAFTGCAVIGGC